MLKNIASLNKTYIYLFIIFLTALAIRFYSFRESTYFGYDEARDAYISQAIYKLGDFKLIGPPANFPGLFHGPLFWYLVGPIYLLGKGDPYFVSAVFRIINCFGVFLVFLVAKKFFNQQVGIFSALIFAFSFEQSQYAMYVGNPTLAIFAFLAIFLGTAILLKDKNPNGILVMIIGAAIATQLELIFLYTFVLILILLFLLRKKIKKVSKIKWFEALGLTGILLSTFIASEVKYNFQSTKALINLFTTGYNVMQSTDSRLTLFIRMFVKLFQYNIINIPIAYLVFPIIIVVCLLVYYGRNNPSIKYVLIWMFASLLILPIGGYDALYVNVGLGIGVIIACGFLLYKIIEKNKTLAYVLLISIILSNLLLIKRNNPDGLIVELKPQPFMKLNDELKLIDKMYTDADGKGFTIRVTGIPYSIQTTWAYLFNYYGKERWGYLPYWEGEMVYGYPGYLPSPKKGTTCQRYLLRDPIRGLPDTLIKKDVNEENLFSKVLKEENINHFLLQTRKAHGDCHNNKAA